MRGQLTRIIWVVLAVVGLVVLTQSAWWEINHSVFAQAAVSGLLIGGVYSLVAMGLSLVFGVLDIINFAHGALMTIAIYASYLLFQNAGIDPVPVLVHHGSVAIPDRRRDTTFCDQ